MPELSEVTLLEHFQRPLDAPNMIGDRGTTKRDSQSVYKKERWPKIRELHRWTDFNPDAVMDLLQTHCPDLLTQTAPYERPRVGSSVRNVYLEENLAPLLQKSQQVVMQDALDYSCEHLPVLKGRKLEMMMGSQAVFRYDKIPGRPDWAGTCSQVCCPHRKKPFNILPGDTKTSWAFQSDSIGDDLLGPEEEEQGQESYGRKGRALAEHKSVWAMRQVAYYCIYSHARYGYIISDKEITVIKIESLYNSTSSLPWVKHLQQHLLVRFATVPNDFSSPGDAHLSLYFLHILAALSGYMIEGDCKHQTLQEYWTRGTPVWEATCAPEETQEVLASNQRVPSHNRRGKNKAKDNHEGLNDRKRADDARSNENDNCDESISGRLEVSHTGLSFSIEDSLSLNDSGDLLKRPRDARIVKSLAKDGKNPKRRKRRKRQR